MNSNKNKEILINHPQQSSTLSSIKHYGACEVRKPSRSSITKSLENGATIRRNTARSFAQSIGCIRPDLIKNNDKIHKFHHPDEEEKHFEKDGEEQQGGEFFNHNNHQEGTLLSRMANRIPCLGIIFAICASFFLGSAGMLVKMTTSIHGIQVAVFRAIIQLFIYGAWISIRKGAYLPERKELIPVMGRAFLGASSITCSYYALKLIPLGDATTIRFSLPIWTLIISYLVLNESCDLFKVGAVVVSIMGVILIAKPDDCIYLMHKMFYAFNWESAQEFHLREKLYDLIKSNSTPKFDPESSHILLERQEMLIANRIAPDFPEYLPLLANDTMREANGLASDELLMRVKREDAPIISELPININYQQFEGCLLALSSSICLALSLVALRLCKKTPAQVTILWLSIISILVGSISLVGMNKWSLPDNWMDVLIIILNGLCGSIGQWFITTALKIEQSGVISLARTFDIEVAFLYSAFVLHEHIRTTSIVGSVLVSTGVIAVVIPKWLDGRAQVEGTSSGDNSGQLERGSSNQESTQVHNHHSELNRDVGVEPTAINRGR